METFAVLLLMWACGRWPGTQVQQLAGGCQDGVAALCVHHIRRSDGDVGVPSSAFLPEAQSVRTSCPIVREVLAVWSLQLHSSVRVAFAGGRSGSVKLGLSDFLETIRNQSH